MRPIDPRLLQRSVARRYLCTAAALALVSAAALIIQAWALSQFISAAYNRADGDVAAAAVVVALVIRGAVGWLSDRVAGKASAGVKAQLRRELVDDLSDPRRLGARPSSATVTTLIGQGLDATDPYVRNYVPQLVFATVIPLSVAAAMLWADPLSGLTVLLGSGLVIGFLILIGLHTQDEIGRRWKAVDRLSRHFADVLDGLVLLSSFGRSQSQGLRASGARHRRATMRSLRLAFTSSLALDLFSTLSVALVAVAVGLRAVYGQLDLATGLFVLLLAPEVFSPIRRLGGHFHDATAGTEAVSAALDILDHPQHAGTQRAPEVGRARLTLANVVVRHEGRRDASLQVRHAAFEPGQLTAITGESGSGKSTLLELLVGLQVPSTGTIEVDGVDLTTIDVTDWRTQLAWVPQEPGLIDGTVADNVQFGTGATDAQIREALRDAGAAELSPHRIVRERRGQISAGERRRVAVARAIVRVRCAGARLVLLDEPTAGLDHASEHTVVETLRALDVTVIVVSHRSETIAAADRVVDVCGDQPAAVAAA